MKYIYCLIFMLGLVLFLGTAGASDCGLLSMGQIVVQVAGGIVMMCLGWRRMFEEGE